MTGEPLNKKHSVVMAQVDWDAGAPRSIFFDDIYFSGDGAKETAHVFLNGNDLPRRFCNVGQFAIGELGFGAGLNFLKCWDLWRQTPKRRGAHLHFLSVEAYPLAHSDMERAQCAWPEHQLLSQRLRALSPPVAPGPHRLELEPGVTLTVWYGFAQDVLAGVEGRFDAWFLDGFSPAKNPELWTLPLMKEVARLSKPRATFATYTVAGVVKRNLADAGFTIEKRPGYGRKKHMLAGRITSPQHLSQRSPWYQNARQKHLKPGATVAIIGGGVAGASLAYAAKRAGLLPTIIDGAGLAAGASGNTGALIMPRLELGGSPTARFFIAAYLYVIRQLIELNAPSGELSDEEKLFDPCGIIEAARNMETCERHRKIIEAGLLPPEWILPNEEGLLFPQAGVVDPRRFIAALAGDCPIIVEPAKRFLPKRDSVGVVFERGGEYSFSAAVLANSVDALRFAEARALPLSAVIGQVDHFEKNPSPRRAVVWGPYMAPAPGGGLLIGATYDRRAMDATTSLDATQSNIAAITSMAPDLALALDAKTSCPRASRRCQTPDNAPAAGPLPDLGFFGCEYDDLRCGVKRPYAPGEMIPGMWILSGLGSRGFVAAPLAAAMIVADMTGAPSPVDYEIAEMLHPARFFIRDLRRARRIRKP